MKEPTKIMSIVETKTGIMEIWESEGGLWLINEKTKKRYFKFDDIRQLNNFIESQKGWKIHSIQKKE